MSFVLWYSVVPFQCRKVWKLICKSLGLSSFVTMFILDAENGRQVHQQREICGQSIRGCYSAFQSPSRKTAASESASIFGLYPDDCLLEVHVPSELGSHRTLRFRQFVAPEATLTLGDIPGVFKIEPCRDVPYPIIVHISSIVVRLQFEIKCFD